jgi:deoxycytidylate deaminase/dephospho-CoA kinase
MSTYIRSAIDTIYRKDDDLIILGLTGRTGSGCSTVAKILCSSKEEIRHSLHSGDSLVNNEARKNRIIRQHFEKNWRPFQLIQVRSVITLLLLEKDIEEILEKLKTWLVGEISDFNILENQIRQIKEQIDSFSQSKDERQLAEYYVNSLPQDSNKIKQLLGESAFVKLYQIVGKNLRLSGDPLSSDRLIEGQFFTLAERINKMIKLIIKTNKDQGESTLIVIDTIRSPLEAIFFQDRYATFNLVAVSAPDDQRKQRLFKQGYATKDVELLDSEEYKARDWNDAAAFSVQDIQACLQRADIYVSNPDEANKVSEFKTLADQIIRFVSLMKHPGLVTPTSIERCMQLAYTAKLNSGCISRQVGAAVTDENFSVQAIGWNDVPKGQTPCSLRNRTDLLEGFDQNAYSEYERTDEKFINQIRINNKKYIPIKATGRNISYCFKSEYNALTNKPNQVHTRSLHAEENAFLQISKHGGGRGVEGGILFTTASPCELCAKKAYQLGIKNIYYIDPYPGIAISHILHGGTANPKTHLFSGAIGRAFHRLYTPILAYKDELAALTT